MSQTADRYSKALFELAQEQNILAAVQDTMTEIRKLIIDLEDFRQFLSNPLLTYEERCAIIKALFEGKVPDLSYRFLKFITYKSRLNILKSIIESFDELYLKTTHQMRVYVKTALPIKDEDKAFIDQHLHKKFQQHIITHGP